MFIIHFLIINDSDINRIPALFLYKLSTRWGNRGSRMNIPEISCCRKPVSCPLPAPRRDRAWGEDGATVRAPEDQHPVTAGTAHPARMLAKTHGNFYSPKRAHPKQVTALQCENSPLLLLRMRPSPPPPSPDGSENQGWVGGLPPRG